MRMVIVSSSLIIVVYNFEYEEMLLSKIKYLSAGPIQAIKFLDDTHEPISFS